MAAKFGEIDVYDPSTDWQSYEGRFRFYLEANGVKDEKAKRAVLLCTVGSAGYKVVEDLNAPTPLSDDSIKFDKLLEQLRGYYYKKPSLLVARTEFVRIRQKDNQSVAAFSIELRNQAARCHFAGDLKTRLRDQFVAGLKNEAIRKRLLAKEDISFEDAEKKATDFERVDEENKTMLTEQHVSQVARGKPVESLASGSVGDIRNGGQRRHWYTSNASSKPTQGRRFGGS